MRRIGHGHTFAAGLVSGLVLDKEALVILGLGMILGAGLVLAWGALRGLLGWVRWRLGPPREPELELAGRRRREPWE